MRAAKPLLALLAALVTAGLLAGPASASTGTITRAYADPSWTKGSLAGSVTFDECQPGFACSWLAYATVQPSLPSYYCNGKEWLEYSDRNIRMVWSQGGLTANGTTGFDLPSASILPAVHGQRLCVSVVYDFWRRDIVCVATAPVFGDDPNNCPYEKVIVSKALASKLLEIEPPPLAPPVAAPPAVEVPPVVSKPKPRKAKRCPKGKRKVKRKGKVRCVKKQRKRGHRQPKR